MLKLTPLKWNLLNHIFSPSKKFEEMKKAISLRNEKGDSCVLYPGSFTRKLVYANDGNKDEIEGEINVEKLHIIADILSNFWKDLSKLRSEGRKAGTNIQFETNLMSCLEKTKDCDDDHLWALSGKIKPFKNV